MPASPSARSNRRPRLRLPHPLILMSGCVFVAAAATWIIPPGSFDRVADPDTGREVVVAGSYKEVTASPATPFEALTAIPRGIVEVADIIALIFLIGGALTVVDRTGALGRGVAALVRHVGRHGVLLLPLLALIFITGGAVFNMAEEIVALIPVLLILTRRLGFGPVVAAMVSYGSAAVGSAFSHMNPFQVILAQQAADVEPGSAAAFRICGLAIAASLWVGFIVWYALRNRSAAGPAEVHDDAPVERRDLVVLALTAATFAYLAWGIQFGGWDFLQMAAPFFALTIVAGFVGGLGNAGTADAFVEGARNMTFASLLIGMARGIVLVLQDARVVDTIVLGLFRPLEDLPLFASAAGMVITQAVIHVPVSSVSGQAVLTMPIVSPLADLLGLSRQVAVLAFHYGAGLTDMVTPTNGSLMAILTAAGVRFEEWIGVVLRIWLVLLAVGIAAVLLAVVLGVS